MVELSGVPSYLALTKLREVAQRWPFHVDPAVALGWEPSMVYSSDQLHHFKSKGLMEANGPRGCIVGEAIRSLGVTLDYSQCGGMSFYFYVAEYAKDAFQKDAALLLSDAQDLNDKGIRWGEIPIMIAEVHGGVLDRL